MPNPTVIKLLEAIRDRHFIDGRTAGFCTCDLPYPCPDRENAEAALKIIEESKDATRHDGSKYKLVPND